MASLVILAVPDGSKAFIAVKALVRFFPCVGSHVDQKVPLLSEDFPAIRNGAVEQVLSGMRRLEMKFKA